jgi:pescadillo protein
VYPRAPQKKPEGADKTYYHVRDIRYLAADPIRFQLYEEEATQKKKTKLVGLGKLVLARELEKRTSQGIDLSHVIRERYPTFVAALMDLDDCISTLALIGSIPTDRESKFSAEVIGECSSLYTEFLADVATAGGLAKTFASIKGFFYFQADLSDGAKVTWLHPHRFANETPADVDMKVLITFCLWYRTLLKFVLYKLYQNRGF